MKSGQSIFNGEQEGATIHDWSGDLTAYFGTETGITTLDANMSKIGSLDLHGFAAGRETVTLTGIRNLADLKVSTSQRNTDIFVTGQSGHVTRYGTTGIDIRNAGTSSVLLS